MMDEKEEICYFCSTKERKVFLTKYKEWSFCPTDECGYSPFLLKLADGDDIFDLIKGSTCGSNSESTRLRPTAPASARIDSPRQKTSPNIVSECLSIPPHDNSASFPSRFQVSKDGLCNLYLKYINWPNRDTLFWLNSSIALLVHSVSVRRCSKTNSFSSCHVLKMFYDYCKILDEINKPSVDNSALCEVLKKLQTMQEYLLRFLNSRYSEQQFTKKSPDLPFITVSMLLQENMEVEQMFECWHQWTWVCKNCPSTIGKARRTIITFHELPDDFNLSQPVSLWDCTKCQTKNQRQLLTFYDMPQSLIFHFENGFVDLDLKNYDFVLNGHEYMVKGIIVNTEIFEKYQFITWIRDLKSNHWLNCDNLRPGFHKFTTDAPVINSSEVHLIMWERVSPDATPPKKMLPMCAVENTPYVQESNTMMHVDQSPNAYNRVNKETVCEHESSDSDFDMLDSEKDIVLPRRLPTKNIRNNSPLASGLENKEKIVSLPHADGKLLEMSLNGNCDTALSASGEGMIILPVQRSPRNKNPNSQRASHKNASGKNSFEATQQVSSETTVLKLNDLDVSSLNLDQILEKVNKVSDHMQAVPKKRAASKRAKKNSPFIDETIEYVVSQQSMDDVCHSSGKADSKTEDDQNLNSGSLTQDEIGLTPLVMAQISRLMKQKFSKHYSDAEFQNVSTDSVEEELADLCSSGIKCSKQGHILCKIDAEMMTDEQKKLCSLFVAPDQPIAKAPLRQRHKSGKAQRSRHKSGSKVKALEANLLSEGVNDDDDINDINVGGQNSCTSYCDSNANLWNQTDVPCTNDDKIAEFKNSSFIAPSVKAPRQRHKSGFKTKTNFSSMDASQVEENGQNSLASKDDSTALLLKQDDAPFVNNRCEPSVEPKVSNQLSSKAPKLRHNSELKTHGTNFSNTGLFPVDENIDGVNSPTKIGTALCRKDVEMMVDELKKSPFYVLDWSIVVPPLRQRRRSGTKAQRADLSNNEKGLIDTSIDCQNLATGESDSDAYLLKQADSLHKNNIKMTLLEQNKSPFHALDQSIVITPLRQRRKSRAKVQGTNLSNNEIGHVDGQKLIIGEGVLLKQADALRMNNDEMTLVEQKKSPSYTLDQSSMKTVSRQRRKSGGQAQRVKSSHSEVSHVDGQKLTTGEGVLVKQADALRMNDDEMTLVEQKKSPSHTLNQPNVKTASRQRRKSGAKAQKAKSSNNEMSLVDASIGGQNSATEECSSGAALLTEDDTLCMNGVEQTGVDPKKSFHAADQPSVKPALRQRHKSGFIAKTQGTNLLDVNYVEADVGGQSGILENKEPEENNTPTDILTQVEKELERLHYPDNDAFNLCLLNSGNQGEEVLGNDRTGESYSVKKDAQDQVVGVEQRESKRKRHRSGMLEKNDDKNLGNSGKSPERKKRKIIDPLKLWQSTENMLSMETTCTNTVMSSKTQRKRHFSDTIKTTRNKNVSFSTNREMLSEHCTAEHSVAETVVPHKKLRQRHRSEGQSKAPVNSENSPTSGKQVAKCQRGKMSTGKSSDTAESHDNDLQMSSPKFVTLGNKTPQIILKKLSQMDCEKYAMKETDSTSVADKAEKSPHSSPSTAKSPTDLPQKTNNLKLPSIKDSFLSFSRFRNADEAQQKSVVASVLKTNAKISSIVQSETPSSPPPSEKVSLKINQLPAENNAFVEPDGTTIQVFTPNAVKDSAVESCASAQKVNTGKTLTPESSIISEIVAEYDQINISSCISKTIEDPIACVRRRSLRLRSISSSDDETGTFGKKKMCAKALSTDSETESLTSTIELPTIFPSLEVTRRQRRMSHETDNSQLSSCSNDMPVSSSKELSQISSKVHAKQTTKKEAVTSQLPNETSSLTEAESIDSELHAQSLSNNNMGRKKKNIKSPSKGRRKREEANDEDNQIETDVKPELVEQSTSKYNLREKPKSSCKFVGEGDDDKESEWLLLASEESEGDNSNIDFTNKELIKSKSKQKKCIAPRKVVRLKTEVKNLDSVEVTKHQSVTTSVNESKNTKTYSASKADQNSEVTNDAVVKRLESNGGKPISLNTNMPKFILKAINTSPSEFATTTVSSSSSPVIIIPKVVATSSPENKMDASNNSKSPNISLPQGLRLLGNVNKKSFTIALSNLQANSTSDQPKQIPLIPGLPTSMFSQMLPVTETKQSTAVQKSSSPGESAKPPIFLKANAALFNQLMKQFSPGKPLGNSNFIPCIRPIVTSPLRATKTDPTVGRTNPDPSAQRMPETVTSLPPNKHHVSRSPVNLITYSENSSPKVSASVKIDSCSSVKIPQIDDVVKTIDRTSAVDSLKSKHSKSINVTSVSAKKKRGPNKQTAAKRTAMNETSSAKGNKKTLSEGKPKEEETNSQRPKVQLSTTVSQSAAKRTAKKTSFQSDSGKKGKVQISSSVSQKKVCETSVTDIRKEIESRLSKLREMRKSAMTSPKKSSISAVEIMKSPSKADLSQKRAIVRPSAVPSGNKNSSTEAESFVEIVSTRILSPSSKASSSSPSGTYTKASSKTVSEEEVSTISTTKVNTSFLSFNPSALVKSSPLLYGLDIGNSDESDC